jgi:DNA polymerase phi
MPAVTAPQVISLLIRNSSVSNGMKGTEERDMLFARLFGLSALVQSSALFAPGSSRQDFEAVIDRLIELGSKKGWLRESAWWAVVQASEKLLKSEVAWKEDGLKGLLTTIKEEKGWTQEKVALVLLLEREMPVSVPGDKLSWFR